MSENISSVFNVADEEIGILGALLVEESILSEVLPLLDKNYFSIPKHKIIYEIIVYLYDENKPINAVSVKEELKRRNLLDEIGGQGYLVTLLETVPSAGNAIYYAQVVREKGITRQLIGVAQDILTYAKSGRLSLENLLDKSEQLIFEVTQKNMASEPTLIKDLFSSVLDEIERRTKGVCSGVLTNFPDLDRMLGGFQKSNLIIIAGRPSMGKTSFCLNAATNIAINQAIGVLIFSLEVPKEQLAQNIICSQLKISPHKITNGTLENFEYHRISTASSLLGEMPIFIDDSAGLSLREIRAKSRRFKAKYNIGLIIIDYLQLMQSSETRIESRQQEISSISRGLKNLARELEIPIISLSQLNRAVDSREDHRPRMSDLRESGALEQDADVILFLYREEYYHPETENKNTAEVIIAKHRNGPTGNISLYFQKEYMQFACIAFKPPT